MKPHEKVHLQVDLVLDTGRAKVLDAKNKLQYVWSVRGLGGGYWLSWTDPRYKSVCGLHTPRNLARRGELDKITCNHCRKYYLKYVGTK